MSGVAGILRFDDGEVARRDLERAANALRSHGPDRSGILVAGRIGLANVLMRILPEDQFDHQPCRGASGALITADIRLDNRNDVLARIGLTPQDAAVWADSRVLLAAWENFGDEIWPMLRGPFAVAIWDPKRRVLTLARDHLGQNVVMWHRSHQFFAFATMPKGLFALPNVPRELNEEKFADFLVLNHAEHATTIYRNIFRVRPAHFVKVMADGSMSQRRYWSTTDIVPNRLPSDEAYAEGLRECLDRAVRRQMRSASAVGCYLSGGLDSSSVSALAARALGENNQRLAAFTHVPREGFDGPVPTGCYADETSHVEAIRSAIGNIDVTYVRSSECDDFSELERFFVAFEAPVRNPTNLGWMLAILRLARAQGRRVLLGGHTGNYTISWQGWSQAVDHLLRGRLLTAFSQWRLFYRRSSYSRWTAFRKLIVEPLVPHGVATWANRRRRPHRIAPWQVHSAIRADFAAAMDINARAQSVGHDFLYRLQPNERMKGLTLIDYAGDWLAAEKAMTGVERRDPTADIDVVSYCFGIPPEQYLAESIDRSLIRRAMWGLLPETTLTNRMRGLQSADWYEGLEGRRDTFARLVTEFRSSPVIRRSIDLDRLDRALKNWPIGAWNTREIIEEYQFMLIRAIAGGGFLRWMESANRSSPLEP